MHTIDWVSADSDKTSLCWLGGKANRTVICTVFIFEIKGPVVYLTLGTNTAEWSQESVKSLVLIYQQLWYFFLRKRKKKRSHSETWNKPVERCPGNSRMWLSWKHNDTKESTLGQRSVNWCKECSHTHFSYRVLWLLLCPQAECLSRRLGGLWKSIISTIWLLYRKGLPALSDDHLWLCRTLYWNLWLRIMLKNSLFWHIKALHSHNLFPRYKVRNACKKVKLKVAQLHLFVTPWTIQSMGFSRPDTGVGSLSLLQGIFPNPGIEPRSPSLQVDSLPAESQGKPNVWIASIISLFKNTLK